MSSGPKPDRVVYGFDPLCGWCFGLIPALETLVRTRPDIPIELRLGGLVTGAKVRPYAEMSNYIEAASQRLESVTGQSLSEAFLKGLLSRPDVIASSTPPSAAIMQVRARYPDRVLAFAHAVQTAHFRSGCDLNNPTTYTDILDRLRLDMSIDLPPPDDPGAMLQREYDETRAMGISSFPTIMIATGPHLETLASRYDPQGFSAEIADRFPVK